MDEIKEIEFWEDFFDIQKTHCPVCGAVDWLKWNSYVNDGIRSLLCVNCKTTFNTPEEFLKVVEEKTKRPNHKTVFNFILDDWKRVKNHCRTTVNKEFTDKEPTEAFKKKLLISEHTPIRLLEVDWSWPNIKSWVSVHWVRHKHEKFVSTQRDDRKEHDISRDEMPQGTLVNMDNYANMQQLIDIFRKRLCHQASPETRALAEDFKVALHERDPEMADVLVPNCIYRNGCPEFEMCKDCHFVDFMKYLRTAYSVYGESCTDMLLNIQKRYDIYNEWFYENYEKENKKC